jgi:hypothetical protein
MNKFKMILGDVEADPNSIAISLDEVEQNIYDTVELMGAWGKTDDTKFTWDSVESSEEINPRNHIIRFSSGQERIVNLQELRFILLCEKVARGESGQELAQNLLEEYKKYTT